MVKYRWRMMKMKISVCVDALYSGKDLFESLEKIKASGYNAFEFWTWWDRDIEKLQQAKETLGMTVTTFCTRFISLVDPAQREAYIKGLEESIVVAKRLGCKQLITQTGNDTNEDREKQKKELIRGLKACVPILEANDITLLVEPLNTRVDHKGYYLYSSAEAFDIIDQVGSEHVKVLFDIYHQQIMEGDIISRIRENIDKIGHFHAAGVPGRNELYYGELNYKSIFDEIDELGFDGYIGFEYFPKDEPEVGLEIFFK